jgi:hypothetical protein
VTGIDSAWVGGDLGSSWAPVYVVVVGNLGVEELDGVLARCRVALDPIVGPSRIELAYFRPADWEARLARGDPFATALREGDRIELCGFAREVRQDSDVA